MKGQIIIFSFIVAFSLAITSCLKDTKFDNQEYGIKDPAGSLDGVGFTLGRSPLETRGLEVRSTSQSISDLLILNLFAAQPANSDVTVSLVSDTNLVNTYNTANGVNFQKLPASLINLSKSQFIVKAGKTVDTISLNIPSTATLNPNLSYAVGFRITSASNGYTVSSNYSTLIVQINIKNKYDGVYRMQGHHNRSPYDFPYDVTMNMITAGPNSVVFYSPDFRSNGHPIGTGIGTISWYGVAISPVIVFNSTTDLVTDVYNNVAGTPITMYTGAGSGVSRFDGSSNPKKIYVSWNYNNNPLRAFFDTLTYIRPR